MLDMVNAPPPLGNEIIFEREADHVLFNGVRQIDGTWTMSLDGEDSTFDPATVSRWFSKS